MSSKDRLSQARALIAQKRYAEARAVLRQIDHPLARDWLAKLDRIATRQAVRRPALKPAPALSLRAQLEVARDLIAEQRYEVARILLQSIEHPLAQDWLDKLDRLAPAVPAPAVILPPPPRMGSAPIDALPRAVQEERLIAAQELILESRFEAAAAILSRLSIPEAALWVDKTQMNKLREFQSLWLDLYYYAPDDDHPDWRCGVCERNRIDAPACPQRGQAPCPLRLHERPIEEPHRLALIVGAIYTGQTSGLSGMVKGISAAQLGHWCAALEQQLRGLWVRDVRRPALENALITLRGLERTRRLTEARG